MPIEKPIINPDLYYSVREITELLQVKKQTVHAWITRGKLKYSLEICGGCKRIKGKDIIDIIDVIETAL